MRVAVAMHGPMTGNDPEARSRAIPESVRLNREARRLTEPLNERVGSWQSESVRLHAAVERMRQSGRHDPTLIEAATALLAQVEAQAQEFEAQIATVARELAAHNRISDSRQSLSMIAERLRRCIV
jgi:hypothetical protein